MLAPIVVTLALFFYVWRRRSVPGALPLALAMLFSIPWAAGATLELAAADLPLKIFWFKFQTAWLLPVNTALTCFILEYANPGRWLNRRTLALLALPILLLVALILTNDWHGWIWLDFSFEGSIRPVYGAGSTALMAYNYALTALQAGVLVWLFVRSPMHRWPVVLILASRVVMLIAFRLELIGRNPVAPMDLAVLTLLFTAAVYTLALFGFRMFDPVPLARKLVIEQMREGMLVLDNDQRVADLNAAAEKILGVRARHAQGRPLAQVLSALPMREEPQGIAGATPSEIVIGAGAAARSYAVDISPLQERGVRLGSLLLLRDVTEEKRAQAQLMEQGRAIAMLEERQRLARDLHDSLGQVLGYVGFQADAARKLTSDGQADAAAEQLTRLSDIARGAQADVREFILNLRMGPSPDQPFLPYLRQYLESYSMQYNLSTSLSAADGFEEGRIEPEARLQLFRIVQEALSNARKHSGAKRVEIRVETADRLARVAIRDDGHGFDPETQVGRRGFGLDFMRERAELLGGRLEIESAPGEGTRVMVEIPI
jgi:PAS domain S-box-containing protein